MRSIMDPALRLLTVCGVAAGSLAFVYKSTEARIAANKAQEKQRRLSWVLPDCPEVETRSGSGGEWSVGKKGGAVCGYAVETQAKGYGGSIQVLVGTDVEGRVTGFSILSHKETPGLGDKAAKPAFQGQFAGLGLDRLQLKKDSAQGGVDALTAATITSRAVTKAVRDGVERIMELRKGELP